jgi:hypothetical protein
MPSSPADATLRELTAVYEDALHALAGGDLEACARSLDRGEALLASPHGAADAELLAELIHGARAAQARLLLVLAGMHRDVGDELARVRQGRRALAGYGGARETGGRVRSDG